MLTDERAARLAAGALALCALGIIGLFLPLATGTIGGVDFDIDISVSSIPVLGVLSIMAAVALTGLPAADLYLRRVRWTGLLVVPAAIGLVPALLLIESILSASDGVAFLADQLPPGSVDLGIGPGAIVLTLVDLGLIGTGAGAIVEVTRSRRYRTAAERPPITESGLPGPKLPWQDPDL